MAPLRSSAPVLALALALAAPALAGCLGAPSPPAVEGAWGTTVPVTVHVVMVGFEGRLDAARLLQGLPVERPLHDLGRFGTQRTAYLEPVDLRLAWQAHEASEDFARAFFRAAQEASFEGPAHDFLVSYDQASGQNRFRPGPLDTVPVVGNLTRTQPTMDYVDAPTLERWLLENRAAYGYGFPGASYTVFLVDSYTDGYLPQDRYHYYYFDDGTIDADLDRPRARDPLDALATASEHFHTPKDPTSSRGWGGLEGVAWLDVGAAPSWLDYQPWVPAFEDDNTDHPVWDLGGQAEKLHRNLNRHLADFALVKVLRAPVYEYEWRPNWVFPVHVFIESAAVSGARTPEVGVDVRTWLGAERIERAFEELAPWVDTTVTIAYHELPMDDPGMAEAVRRAKAYGSAHIVNAGVIKEHVRANWEQYVPEEDDRTRVFPQFLFYFDGPWTFWGPNQGGGFADADAWGRPWAAFNHIFDVCVKADEVPCTKATKWEGEGSMDMLVIHEGGHHVGLTHARDTAILDDDRRDDRYHANWFWDSVWSVMTYRHQNPGFDQFDRDAVARGHAGWVLQRVAERLPGLPAQAAQDARAGIAQVEGMLQQGRWADAARGAIATHQAIEASGALRASAAPLRIETLPTVAQGFGGGAMVPVSLGAAQLEGFVPADLPFERPLSAWSTPVEVPADAVYVRIGFRDTRPDAGPLRAAEVVLRDPAGEFLGAASDDVFAEAYVTGLRGPGTYEALLLTYGGVASEYIVTLDVHRPA